MSFLFVPRADWGARPPKWVTAMAASRVEGIFDHYRGPGGAPLGQAAESAALRNDQNYHMDTKGWADLAYNWAVGQSGLIYEGRGWEKAGGHTEGWNGGRRDAHASHAVLWIGGQDASPSDAAYRSLKIVNDESRRRYGGFVKPHLAVSKTACPGRPITDWLNAGEPVTGGPTPAPTIPQEEEDMSAVLDAIQDCKKVLVHYVERSELRVKQHVEHVVLRTAVPVLVREIVAARDGVVGGASADEIVDEIAARLKP